MSEINDTQLFSEIEKLRSQRDSRFLLKVPSRNPTPIGQTSPRTSHLLIEDSYKNKLLIRQVLVEIEKMKEMNKSELKETTALLNTRDVLEAEFKELEKKIAAEQSTIHTLEIIKAAFPNLKNPLKQKEIELAEQKEKYKAEIERVKSDSEKTVSHYQTKIEEESKLLRTQIHDLVAKVKEAEIKLTEENKKKYILEEEKKLLVQELETLNQSHTSISRDKVSSDAMVSNLNNQIKDKDQKIRDLTNNLQLISEKYQQEIKLRISAQQDKAVAQEELFNLRFELAKTKEHNAINNEKLETQLKEIAAAKHSSEENLKRISKNFEEDLHLLTAENDILKQSILSLEEDIKVFRASLIEVLKIQSLKAARQAAIENFKTQLSLDPL